MEGAEPLPRRSLSVLPKLTTALPLITKRAQHPKNTQKRLFRQTEPSSLSELAAKRTEGVGITATAGYRKSTYGRYSLRL